MLLETPVLLMTRAEGTWLVLLPLKRLLASTPFSEKAVAGVALSIRPDGRVAKAGVGAGSAGEFGVHARRLSSQAGKAPSWQGHRINLRRVHHVAVGRVHGVHQRRGFHFNCGRRLAHLERGVHRRSAVRLHRDVLRFLHIESISRVGKRVACRWEDSRTYMCPFHSFWSCASDEVCSSTTVTVALGMTPPDGSVTSPVMPPSVCCARQGSEAQRNGCRNRQQPGKCRGEKTLGVIHLADLEVGISIVFNETLRSA